MLKFTKTSSKLEMEGVWLDYEDGAGDTIKLLVARSDGNIHYETKLTKLMAPHKKKIERGKSISNELAKKIISQVLASEILLGWDETKLIGDDEKPVRYSPEAALELLTYDNDLRDWLVDQAGDQSNFLIQKK